MLINQKKFLPRIYSSGEVKLVQSYLNSFVQNNSVEIFFENDFSIFELIIIIKYYTSKNVKVKLILTYLPYQRMDHKGRDELDTLRFVAQIFNELNLESLTICEPHASIDEFKNAQKFDFVKNIKDRVFKQIGFDENQDCVVLTDKGGFLRYNGIAKNITYFKKERDIETGLIVNQEIASKIDISKKIVIVDDIISTGDTIVGIVDYLKSLGAKQIYVMSGHIENNKYNMRLAKFEEVKGIYSTNSLKKKGYKKVKLFDAKEVFYGQEFDK